MPEIRSVLGFDYGFKRIGVATGQTITATSTPLTTVVQRDDGSHWQQIQELVERWRPDALLLGIPYMLDGSETAMGDRVREFKQELEQRFPLPVILVDETLSSAEAEEILARKMQLGQHNKAEVDRMAAAIIVQGWLDQHT